MFPTVPESHIRCLRCKQEARYHRAPAYRSRFCLFRGIVEKRDVYSTHFMFSVTLMRLQIENAYVINVENRASCLSRHPTSCKRLCVAGFQTHAVLGQLFFLSLANRCDTFLRCWVKFRWSVHHPPPSLLFSIILCWGYYRTNFPSSTAGVTIGQNHPSPALLPFHPDLLHSCFSTPAFFLKNRYRRLYVDMYL